MPRDDLTVVDWRCDPHGADRCYCEDCCRQQPWRRKVLRATKKNLRRRLIAMRAAKLSESSFIA
jgi:hypothetical protein